MKNEDKIERILNLTDEIKTVDISPELLNKLNQIGDEPTISKDRFNWSIAASIIGLIALNSAVFYFSNNSEEPSNEASYFNYTQTL